MPKIQDYKGFEIHFNTEQEAFFVAGDSWADIKPKASYSAAKSAIDKFVKENGAFKPFKIMSVGVAMYDNKIVNEITIIGRHGNGNLVTDDKRQLSSRDLARFFLADPANTEVVTAIVALEAERVQANADFAARRVALNAQLVRKSVAEYLQESGI